jgi:hypothetical protein
VMDGISVLALIIKRYTTLNDREDDKVTPLGTFHFDTIVHEVTMLRVQTP